MVEKYHAIDELLVHGHCFNHARCQHHGMAHGLANYRQALYFALANMHERFAYLKYGLAAVLVFVGAKMLLVDFYKVPVVASLGVIFTILTLSVMISLRATRKLRRHS